MSTSTSSLKKSIPTIPEKEIVKSVGNSVTNVSNKFNSFPMHIRVLSFVCIGILVAGVVYYIRKKKTNVLKLKQIKIEPKLEEVKIVDIKLPESEIKTEEIEEEVKKVTFESIIPEEVEEVEEIVVEDEFEKQSN